MQIILSDCSSKVANVVLQTSLLFILTGEPCSSYDALKLKELAKGKCRQIKETTEQWLTIKCQIYRYRQSRDFFRCGLLWCKYFTLCLEQTLEWRTLCSRKFSWYRSSRFDIATAAGGINATYLKNVQVQYCGRKIQDRNYLVETVAIKITKSECQSKYTGKGLYFPS